MDRAKKTGWRVPAPKELTTESAAEQLGISPSQFRRIAATRGYEPSRIEEWRYGRSSGTKFFWSRRTIAAIRRTREYVRTIERATSRSKNLDELRARREREAEERRQAEEAVLAEAERLPLHEHVRLALECLHAANRAAKHPARVQERALIYATKDRYLAAMLRANLASVGTFEILQTGRRQLCTECGHEWVGHSCCYSCDKDSGVALGELRRWYLVDCGSGHRFHQPNLDADLAARAVPIEPHDPTQEARTVPSVYLPGGHALDVGMQVKIVLSAAARLTAGPATLEPTTPREATENPSG